MVGERRRRREERAGPDSGPSGLNPSHSVRRPGHGEAAQVRWGLAGGRGWERFSTPCRFVCLFVFLSTRMYGVVLVITIVMIHFKFN